MIQELIDKGFKAIIVECGHGALISNAFLSAKSASILMAITKQPYAKEVQAIEYPETIGMRSVSKEFVHNVLKTELNRYRDVYPNNPIICIATSFQLGNENSICHGYFGFGNTIRLGNDYRIFHVTFYKHGLTKSAWISKIKAELMNLLAKSMNVSNGTNELSNFLDGTWSVDDVGVFETNIEKTLYFNNKTNKYVFPEDENFICISPTKELIRFEDILRLNKMGKRGIIMQKGSFNPFHRMHNNIAIDAQNAYPDYPHVLVLSNNTCDKGVNDEKVLTERIERLTALGYYVMVTKSGQFLDNINKIRDYYEDLHVIFPVGEDTIERFLRDWEKYFTEGKLKSNIPLVQYNQYMISFQNVDWYITKRNSNTKHFGDLIPRYKKYLNNFKYSSLTRDDISSSAIRAGHIENTL